MNFHEACAWRILRELGARETRIGGKRALDLSPIRATSGRKLGLLVQAVVEVVGRSGSNRRHLDRRGCPVYVVTDDAPVATQQPEPSKKARPPKGKTP